MAGSRSETRESFTGAKNISSDHKAQAKWNNRDSSINDSGRCAGWQFLAGGTTCCQFIVLKDFFFLLFFILRHQIYVNWCRMKARHFFLKSHHGPICIDSTSAPLIKSNKRDLLSINGNERQISHMISLAARHKKVTSIVNCVGAKRIHSAWWRWSRLPLTQMHTNNEKKSETFQKEIVRGDLAELEIHSWLAI